MKKKLLGDYISPSKTNLIFDFDETIVKVKLPWERIFDDIKKDLILFDKKIFEDFKNKKMNASDFRNKYVLRFGDKAKNIILNSQKSFEKDNLKGYLQNKSIIDFVEKNEKHKMYIWSSNTRSTVEKVLKELDILNRFSLIVCSEDVNLLKPYTDGYAKINTDNISKSRYLFIGDSVNDRKAAEKIGIDYYQEDYFSVPGKYW
jgi:HAD superfamily hydrolase (TIGR01549 family)